MKPRTRLGVNQLEDRSTPTVTGLLSGGNLIIQGSADTGTPNLTVTQTGATQFTVLDNGVKITGSPFTVTRDVFIQPNNTVGVTVNYNANNLTSPGAVTVRLGNGNNTFNLINGAVGTGSIKGALNVFTGTGDDTFNIGGSTAGQLSKFAWLNLGAGGGQNDTVNVTNQAVPRGLSIQAAETVTIDPNVTTDNTSDVNVQFADGFNSLILNGETKRNVNVSVQNVSQSFLLLQFNGKINGSLDVRGGSFNALGFMTADVNGDVVGNATFLGTGGSDVVTFAAASTPANIGVNLYGGLNQTDVNTPVNQTIIVYGGGDSDTVNINGTAKYLSFDLGGGDDTLNVTANISININGFLRAGNDTVNINAGSGTAGQANTSVGLDLGEGDDVATLSGTYNGGVVVYGQAGADTINLAAGSVFNQGTSPGRIWLDFGADTDIYNNASGDASLNTDNGTTIRIFNLP